MNKETSDQVENYKDSINKLTEKELDEILEEAWNNTKRYIPITVLGYKICYDSSGRQYTKRII